jgi:acyl-CoA reductase-like NAD-dependent aldehyde dehydrogenase
LTPVTLELGGKSPCIIDKEVNLQRTVPRIAFGKYNNAGQTCIAPDYVLCHKDRYDEFLSEMKKCVHRFFGENPQQSDLGKIINSRHTKRIGELIKGHEIYFGGEIDEEKAYVSPTLITNPDPNSKLMKEEIFGPVLPVIPIDNLDQAVKCKILYLLPFQLLIIMIFIVVNEREKPLAVYIYSDNRKEAEKVLNKMSFGGGCVNECLMHCICLDLPFGGVGESGIGAYNGKSTLDLCK